MATKNTRTPDRRGSVRRRSLLPRPFELPADAWSFDSSGDLRLSVGAERQLFVVCSHAMSRASPVLAEKLAAPKPSPSPRDRKRLSSSPIVAAAVRTVVLPDDNASAFRILCDIVHGRFAFVPKTLSWEELFEVTILIAKYDMAEALRPWARGWCAVFDGSLMLWKAGRENLLWAAWVFGRRDVFRSVARDVLYTCYVDDEGRRVTATGVDLDKSPSFAHIRESGILESIWTVRLQAIDKLLRLVQHHWLDKPHENRTPSPQTPTTTTPTQRYTCHRKVGSFVGGFRDDIPFRAITPGECQHCEAVIAGSFTRGLEAQGLLPLPEPHMVRKSLDGLVMSIRNAAGAIFTISLHQGCDPGPALTDEAYEVLWTLPAEVTEKHAPHLYAQGRKTGILE